MCLSAGVAEVLTAAYEIEYAFAFEGSKYIHVDMICRGDIGYRIECQRRGGQFVLHFVVVIARCLQFHKLRTQLHIALLKRAGLVDDGRLERRARLRKVLA